MASIPKDCPMARKPICAQSAGTISSWTRGFCITERMSLVQLVHRRYAQGQRRIRKEFCHAGIGGTCTCMLAIRIFFHCSNVILSIIYLAMELMSTCTNRVQQTHVCSPEAVGRAVPTYTGLTNYTALPEQLICTNHGRCWIEGM